MLNQSLFKGEGIIIKKFNLHLLYNKLIKINPAWIFTTIIFYLVAVFIICYLVDIINIFELRHTFENLWCPFAKTNMQPLWAALLLDNSITQVVQLITLAGIFYFAHIISKKLYYQLSWKKAAMFWGILSVAAMLMFLEEKFNIRFILNATVIAFANVEEYDPTGVALRSTVELLYYTVLGFIPLYALFRFGRPVWEHSKTRYFILFGYFMYGYAAIASASRYIYDWYTIAGGKLLSITENYTPEELVYFETEDRPMEYWIMDLIIEEPVELLGGAGLLTAVLIYCRYIENIILPNSCKKTGKNT